MFSEVSQGFFDQSQELEISLWQNEFLVIISNQNLRVKNLVRHYRNNNSSKESDEYHVTKMLQNCREIQALLGDVATIKNISIPSVSPISSVERTNIKEVQRSLLQELNNQLSATRTIQNFSDNKSIEVSFKKMEQLIEANQLIFDEMISENLLQANLK